MRIRTFILGAMCVVALPWSADGQTDTLSQSTDSFAPVVHPAALPRPATAPLRVPPLAPEAREAVIPKPTLARSAAYGTIGAVFGGWAGLVAFAIWYEGGGPEVEAFGFGSLVLGAAAVLVLGILHARPALIA